MPDRDLGCPVTVINRFEVKGDPRKFEREFREHSQFLRRREDFDFLVTVQLIEEPHVYVHLGHWRTLRGFLDTVHDETFLVHVKRLGPMVEVEADQAVSVRRVLVDNALIGVDDVVLTRIQVRGDWRLFERRFAELDDTLGALGGFGGSDLLRSTVSPFLYTGVHWWQTADDCGRALGNEPFADWLRDLEGIASVTVERTRHVAYERATT